VEEAGFADVYRRHSSDVHRFALWLSGDVHMAEEVTAETFARAWVARGRIREATVKAYLLSIARNLCIDVGRKRTHAPLDDAHEIADGGADQERAEGARREWVAVVRALRELPELDRTVLLMAAIGGLDHAVIGQTVGLSAAAVKARVHRARARLNAARALREVPR
jgi:RNA polymerase sigma-70 factor (ECF subfamily)